jgi:hypothetical protein
VQGNQGLDPRIALGARRLPRQPPAEHGQIRRYLNGADGWLFSDECNNVTPEEMKLQRDDNRSRTEEMLCAAFYVAEHEYTPKKDRKMEEGARTAATERAVAEGGGNTDGEGNSEDDHDMRRLPIKRRMDITMKNKNEADKLFSDENYRGAARPPRSYSTCPPHRRRR